MLNYASIDFQYVINYYRTITARTQIKELEDKYINEGYVKANIVFFKNEDDLCSFLIKLENSALLEPLSLSNEFKTDKTAVWIKYAPQ